MEDGDELGDGPELGHVCDFVLTVVLLFTLECQSENGEIGFEISAQSQGSSLP